MRLTFVCLSVALLMTLIWAGCSNSTSPTIPMNPDVENRSSEYVPDEFCGDPMVVPLIAGQTMDIGTVTVTNDENYMYVHIVVQAPWVIVETHIEVSGTLDGIPHNKSGNPQIGHFRYTMDSMIPLEWDCGTEVFVAVHAVVNKLGPNGEILQKETGWGKGYDFPGKSWAMYFMYTIQCCKDVSLPDSIINATFTYPGPTSYWQTNLSGVPSGYNVWDGPWVGWCVDQGHYIQPGNPYTVRLYSSYSPSLPAYAQDDDWDMVNWIINHKNAGATIQDIQDAIWYFIGGGPMPIDPEALAMVNDALANGEGYRPGVGQWFAVIVDPIEWTSNDRSQLTFIEVDP